MSSSTPIDAPPTQSNAPLKESEATPAAAGSEFPTLATLFGSGPTALTAAFMRHIAPEWTTPGAVVRDESGDALGRDSLAHYFLTDHQLAVIEATGLERLRQELNRQAPSLPAFSWQRARVIDSQVDRLIRSGDPPLQQLLILGAGFDTRCFRFADALRQRGITGFEIDRPELQADKRARLEDIAQRKATEDQQSASGDAGAKAVAAGSTSAAQFREALKAVTFVPFDLAQPKKDLLAALAHTNYRTDRVTLTVWSGVVMYLTKQAILETLEFLHEAGAPGSRLLCDFTVQPPADSEASALQAKIKRELKRKGEPFQFVAAGPEEFAAMLEEKGWEVERLFTPEVLQNEFGAPEEGTAWSSACMVLAKLKKKQQS